jgi:putative ABC transport system permease protein
MLLSVAGAVVGVALAFAGVRGLLLLAPENAAVNVNVSIDATVLLFTALATVVAGVLFGVAPAWQISRMDHFDSLREGGRSGAAGMRRQHLRAGLVIGEVALALVLLVSSGLLLRSLAALQEVNPGFQPDDVLTGAVSLPQPQYAQDPKQIAFYHSLLDRLSAIPGVNAAGIGLAIPFTGQPPQSSISIKEHPSPPGDPGPHGELGFVTPGYFAALKIPLKRGRLFTDQDREKSAEVALIDDTFARQYFPNENPLGKHLSFGGPNVPWSTIVGVVGHTKSSDLAGDESKGKYYFPLFQQTSAFTYLVLRSQVNPERLAAGLREAVRSVDPAIAVSRIKVLSDMVAASLAARRFVVTVLGIFASLALLLAVIGLYGVISYSVTQRTQELGVRMALGAQTSQVLRLVIREGMQLAGIGAACGLAASIAFSRVLRSQLYQVSAFDPLTLLVTAMILIGAALLASYIPARRATRVDPMEALRYEF